MYVNPGEKMRLESMITEMAGKNDHGNGEGKMRSEDCIARKKNVKKWGKEVYNRSSFPAQTPQQDKTYKKITIVSTKDVSKCIDMVWGKTRIYIQFGKQFLIQLWKNCDPGYLEHYLWNSLR